MGRAEGRLVEKIFDILFKTGSRANQFQTPGCGRKLGKKNERTSFEVHRSHVGKKNGYLLKTSKTDISFSVL